MLPRCLNNTTYPEDTPAEVPDSVLYFSRTGRPLSL